MKILSIITTVAIEVGLIAWGAVMTISAGEVIANKVKHRNGQ